MITDKDRRPLPVPVYDKDTPVFLVCGGKSFNQLTPSQKEKLAAPGAVTMGVNNSVKTFRPTLWTSVDDPGNFLRSIFYDATMTKFVCHNNRNKRVFDSVAWRFTDRKIHECPNVFFYTRNDHLRPSRYLTQESFNWGNHKHVCSGCFSRLNKNTLRENNNRPPKKCPSCNQDWNGGGRSVMLLAIRLLYTLGFRKIYLLGVDFTMSAGNTYHFEQSRAAGSIKGNSDTYDKLKSWFVLLNKEFLGGGLRVFNCNPDSGLRAFPFLSVDDALDDAETAFGFDALGLQDEPTEGLYDRAAKERPYRNTCPCSDDSRTGKYIYECNIHWFLIPADELAEIERQEVKK